MDKDLAIGVKALQARIEYLERELDAARSRQSQQAQGEAVSFTCHGNSAPAYSCNKPGDMSGTYYRHPPEPVAVPEGWKLVPIEPTETMVNACVDAAVNAAPAPWFPSLYRALIAAAPSPTDKNHQQAALFRAHNGGED